MSENILKTRRERAREQVASLRELFNKAVSMREQGRFQPSVRAGYEVVEKSLKAALLFVDVEPPPWVNVGPQLEDHADRFPESFRDQLDIAVYAARVSWEEREAGIGVPGGPAGESPQYDDYDAESALETAERVLGMVEDLTASV